MKIEPCQQTEFIALRAATCLAMMEFINGAHDPRLARLIIHQLGRLLAHPGLERLPGNRDRYRELLAHWQIVAAYLQEQPRDGAYGSYHSTLQEDRFQ